jgi:hypothetical protein
MTETLRITVKAPDADTAARVKDQFFKQLYEHSGSKVVFELPVGADAEADAITTFAEEAGCTVDKEVHKDELEDAEPVDFW